MTDIIVSCVRTHGIQQSARDYSVRLLRQVNLSILLWLAHHQRDIKDCELLGPFKNSGSLGFCLHGLSTTTTSALTLLVLASLTASMMCLPVEGLSWIA